MILWKLIEGSFPKCEEGNIKMTIPFQYKICGQTKRIRKTEQQKREDLKGGVDPKATKNIPKNYAKAIITYILKN